MVEYEDVVAAAKSVPKVEPKSLIRTVDDLTVIDFFRKARDWAAQRTQTTSEYGAIREPLEKIDESLGVMEDIKPEIRPFKLVRYKLHDSYIDCFWSFKDLLDSTEKSFKKPEDAYREYVDLLSQLPRPQPLQLVTSDWRNKVKRLCELLAILLEPLPLPIVCGFSVSAVNDVVVAGVVDGWERRGTLEFLDDLIIAAWYYEDRNAGLVSSVLTAFTRDGELVWAKTPYLEAPGAVIGYKPSGLAVVDDTIFLAANAYTPEAGSQGLTVIAFDREGNPLWAKREINHWCTELKVGVRDGVLYIGGSTAPEHAVVIGITTDGELVFEKNVRCKYDTYTHDCDIEDVKVDERYVYLIGGSYIRDPVTEEIVSGTTLIALDGSGEPVFNKVCVLVEGEEVKDSRGRAGALANDTIYVGATNGVVLAIDLSTREVVAAKRVPDVENTEDMFWDGDLWYVGIREVVRDETFWWYITTQARIDPSLASAQGKRVRGDNTGVSNDVAGRCIRVRDGVPYVFYQADTMHQNDGIMFITDEIVGTIEWEEPAKGVKGAPMIVEDYSAALEDVYVRELVGDIFTEVPYYEWYVDDVKVLDKTEELKQYLRRALYYRK